MIYIDIILLVIDMREYLKEYIDSIEEVINSKKVNKDIIEEHLIKISFFQHERLIHLLVTLFYALVLLLFIGLTLCSYIFIPIVLILLVFVILYIYHYFYLENHIQYMYKQYDKLKKLDK